jgi:NAD(P)-dependent dehydrogenase (short-subunit alcohol dehydrogenase family)
MHTTDAVDALVSGNSLQDRHAWVTGAGKGLGQASAVALARLGACVHIISRTEDDLKKTADLIGEFGGTAEIVVCDVTDYEHLRSVFADAIVDVLVNSAGTNIPEPIADVSAGSYETIMGLNVKSTLFAIQFAVSRMRQGGRGGSIVNLTSQMGHVGGPNRAVYCASKWAVEGMTKALALELAPEGIRVNTVSPTFVETPMTAGGLSNPDFQSWVLGEIPLGRLGRIDEVAAAVAFLASPMSSLTTGSSLLADGGWTAH